MPFVAAFIFLMILDSSRAISCAAARSLLASLMMFEIFSPSSLISMATESTRNPRKSIYFCGSRHDLGKLITKPRFLRK